MNGVRPVLRPGRLMLVSAVLAAAATGMAAAPSAAPAEPALQLTAAALPLSSAETGSAALTSLSTGRRDLFMRSSTGAVDHQYFLPGGSWRRPVTRGGGTPSQPAVVSWAPSRLDLFVRGGDDALWHRSYQSGTWSGWESLGGNLTSAPAVASQGEGQLDVFARGTDNVLVQRSFSAGVWGAWTTLGGTLSSSPAATSSGPGTLAVVVRGSNNSAWLRSSAAGVWGSWRNLGGGLSAQPAIASPAPGQLDVAVRGSDLRMFTTRVTGSASTGWTALGADTFTSGPTATAFGDDVVVTAKKSNGFYYQATRSSPTAAWSAWRIVDQYLPFRRLATWVDTLDYGLTPSTAIADMKARGVRTLFLSTGRFNSANDFFDETKMADWLDRAHAAGIRVVGWYVPAYGDMARDVRRVVAINDYLSPGGQRFDGIGVDIERWGTTGAKPNGEVDRATFNARAIPHLQQVRSETSAPMAAIVPTPFTTNAGNNWSGFPWSGIGPNSEVVVPMSLWTFRSNLSPSGVSTYVKNEIDRTQALTGRRVHVEGGVLGEPKGGTTPFDTARLQAFVNSSKAAGAVGGSNYDYATFTGVSSTTKNTWWGVLRGFNTL